MAIIQKKIRRYSELITIPTFEERFEYLKLNGKVGVMTFKAERYLNQAFYHSEEWKHIRNDIIIRDCGLDLAFPDHEIIGSIIIHHMNPIEVSDICEYSDYLVNPEYLICVSANTHRALHYGNLDILPKKYVERTPGDTCPWKYA